MRFATKILLLTLALTVGLSALIVSVVSARVTANERTRARADIRRAIDDYLERIDHRARSSMRTVHLLLEFPQNRSYLQALNEAGPGAPEETLVHIREEVLARELQTELGATFVPPAFHALTNRRGEALALASVDPQLRRSAAGLASLAWPAQGVVESGELQKVYVELDGRLFLALGIPLRAEIGGDWVMAYFVGFEINDAWVRALSGGGTVTAAGREPLHVVVQLAGRTIASSAPGDGALTVTLPRRPAGAPATRVEQLPIEFTSGGETFVGEALLVPASAGDAVFAFYSSLDRALAPLRGLKRQILLATAGVAIVAFVVSRFISRMFARPVEQLVAGTERIARGEFGVPIEMRRRDELGALARSFNQMAAGLEQRDLIKDTFGKFVDPSVVQSLLDDPSRLRLGGERRVQTILFADLEDFTRASERPDPEALFRLLNGFLERAADVVAERRGIVDK